MAKPAAVNPIFTGAHSNDFTCVQVGPQVSQAEESLPPEISSCNGENTVSHPNCHSLAYFPSPQRGQTRAWSLPHPGTVWMNVSLHDTKDLPSPWRGVEDEPRVFFPSPLAQQILAKHQHLPHTDDF